MTGVAEIVRDGRAVHERERAVDAVLVDAAIEQEIDFGAGPQRVGAIEPELIGVQAEPVGHGLVAARDVLMRVRKQAAQHHPRRHRRIDAGDQAAAARTISRRTVIAALAGDAAERLEPDISLGCRPGGTQAVGVVEAADDGLLQRALRGVGRLRRRAGENGQASG